MQFTCYTNRQTNSVTSVISLLVFAELRQQRLIMSHRLCDSGHLGFHDLRVVAVAEDWATEPAVLHLQGSLGGFNVIRVVGVFWLRPRNTQRDSNLP